MQPKKGDISIDIGEALTFYRILQNDPTGDYARVLTIAVSTKDGLLFSLDTVGSIDITTKSSNRQWLYRARPETDECLCKFAVPNWDGVTHARQCRKFERVESADIPVAPLP